LRLSKINQCRLGDIQPLGSIFIIYNLDWDKPVMEYWSTGVLEKTNTPTLQHSITPVDK
jgi:hypothetical protein